MWGVSNITKGQKHSICQYQVNVIKGHPVQIFKKCILSFFVQTKHFKHHMRPMSIVMSKSPKVINCKFSKEVCFSVPMHMEGIPGIMGGQNQVKIIKGHQVQFFKMCIFQLLCTEKLF